MLIRPQVTVGKNAVITHQFGKLNVAVGVSTELCVPSKKTLMP